MDPRKAATITEQSLKDAFAEGMAEGRAEALGEVEPAYRVTFLLKTTVLRRKVYSDLVEALTAVGEHLAHGVGTNATVTVIDVSAASEDEPEDPELPATT